jgi:NADH dehydrogenase FAD-containing subunit
MNTSDSSKFPLVVIIGGGFGGLQVAKKLADKPVDVLMLDKHNYHTFQPLIIPGSHGQPRIRVDSIFPTEKLRRSKKLSLQDCRSNQN